LPTRTNNKVLIKPYENEPGTRKQQVVQMFNAIAGRYDFLNHFLSFNIDVLWRKRLVRTIKKLSRESSKPLNQLNILDIATGTGDLAFEISSISPLSITGVDISEEMLKIAQKKGGF
jgi:demethylmenaquinone methyltransferase/2-methoxy-6-polyprenyl-1,4-benzoquinol methylase